MKIDTASPPSRAPLSSRVLNHEVPFQFQEILNTTPSAVRTRQSDEYYWQYQNKLQQSDLQFNPAIINEKITSANNETIKQTITSSKAPDNIIKKQELPASTMIADQYVPHLTMRPHYVAKPFMVWLEKMKAGYYFDTSTVNKSVIKKSCNHQVIKTQLLLGDTSFKNYQLFFNKSEAELTLNTSQITKEDASELQRFIKQWLNHKGYVLKQVIINGVLQ